MHMALFGLGENEDAATPPEGEAVSGEVSAMDSAPAEEPIESAPMGEPAEPAAPAEEGEESPLQ